MPKFEKRDIRKGVAIVRQPTLTKYWSVRFWDNARKGYVVRSTKETGSVAAKAVAEEIIREYYSKGRAMVDKVPPQFLFKTYAAQLVAQNALDGSKSVRKDDSAHLNRKGGILDYFGEMDVREITTAKMREFLNGLNAGRDKPLSSSTTTKFISVIRKVLRFAKDAGVITAIPEAPKITMKQEPRPGFSEAEYLRLLKEAREAADRGDVVRGVKVTRDFYHAIVFMVGSFLRPTEGEFFALKHEHITLKTNPTYLELRIAKGKTGFRIAPTMPVCSSILAKQIRLTGRKTGYVFLPQHENRRYAMAVFRRVFIHLMDKAGLRKDVDGADRTAYSLRHTAIQRRLLKSGGGVNILWLAEAAGTSPDMIRKFYVARMGMVPEKVANIHYTMPKAKVIPD